MSNMITVRRANVLLDVSEDQKDEYLAKGFDVIDKDGNVVTEATVTNDVSTLHKKLAEAQEKIKILEEENKRLNEELDSLAEDSLTEEEAQNPEQEGLVDPPKKSSKKKTAKE